MLPEFKLNNGTGVPAIGLGTHLAKSGEEAYHTPYL